MKLSDIPWVATGTGLADSTLVPTSYTVAVTYAATGGRGVATGYVTAAGYADEVKAEDVEVVEYTVIYLGSPMRFLAGFNPMWLPAGGKLPLLAGTGGITYTVKRPHVIIRTMDIRDITYKKLGKQRTSTRIPKPDLTKLREYSAGDANVEPPGKLVHKLVGRIVIIQIYGGDRTHLVGVYNGQDNYRFAVKEDVEEKEESKS